MRKLLAKTLPISLFIISIGLYILGLINPILGTSMFLGLKKQSVYLFDSVEYFYEEGELFIGTLLLIFTFIFPILKYIVVLLKIIGTKFRGSTAIDIFIEIINKWAMLDVFVVALIIINMKMDSIIIVTKLKIGTTYFAASIVLLMICSLYLKFEKRIFPLSNTSKVSDS